LRDLNPTLVTDHTTVFHSLILPTQAFPVSNWTEHLGTEQAVTLRLKCPIINGLWLGNFAVRPGENPIGRREADSNRVEISGQRTTLVETWSHGIFILYRYRLNFF